MDSGEIIINTGLLKYPGNILYVAGHIAVLPRDSCYENGYISAASNTHQATEIIAMAWSYATCIHLGFGPYIVFPPDGYKGQSEKLIKHYRETPQGANPCGHVAE